MIWIPLPLIYGDVCSGLSAPTLAWKHLGWRAAFYAEIEPAPSAVLAHHYPTVKNHGDFTTIQKGDYEPIDVLVGGTPCQDFSIAGLRAGMGGERGNLTLEFLRLADRLRPRWLVWENVPGVLSSTSHVSPDQRPPNLDLEGDDEPRDGEERVVVDEYDADEVHAFNSFLAGLSELGYGFAYRVIDAQYCGVPQRRRRVFVVGHLGRLVESGDTGEVWDVREASALSRAVLFERQSLSGDTPPRREPGQVAPTIPSRSSAGGGLGSDFDFDFDGGLVAQAFGGNNTSGPIEIATAVNASGSASGRIDFESETFVCSTLDASYARLQGQSGQDANHGHSHPVPVERRLLPGDEEHFDREEWEHNGRLVPLAIQAGALRENSESGPDGVGVREDGIAYTLEARPEVQAVAFSACGQDGFTPSDVCPPLTSTDGGGTVPTIAFDCKASGRNGFGVGDISPTLRSMGHKDSHSNAGGQVAVCFDTTQITSPTCRSNPREGDPCHPLAAGAHPPAVAISGRARGDDGRGYVRPEHMSIDVAGTLDGVKVDRVLGPSTMAVRRLTPRECERLQGVPDDFTLVPYRNGMMADGPRYKMLGNSMNVQCMAWIGERIQMVEAQLKERVKV